MTNRFTLWICRWVCYQHVWHVFRRVIYMHPCGSYVYITPWSLKWRELLFFKYLFVCICTYIFTITLKNMVNFYIVLTLYCVDFFSSYWMWMAMACPFLTMKTVWLQALPHYLQVISQYSAILIINTIQLSILHHLTDSRSPFSYIHTMVTIYWLLA